ncbi:MAG: alpha/beta fold hydrolase [Armatimonadota bacterium]
MPFAHVNNTEIFYTVSGDGYPLIFFHGLGNDIGMLRYQIEYFRQKCKVIVPDLRGNGYSEYLNVPVSRVLQTQCDDAAALMDSLKIDKAVIAGISYGGVIAQLFAVTYPDKVKGLVVCDSFCDTRITSFNHLILRLLTNMFPVFCLPRRVMVWFINRRYREWPSANKELSRIAMKLRRCESARQQLALVNLNLTDRLPGIDAPALCLAGDRMQIEIDLMRQVSDLIPHSRFLIISDSTDPSNLCQPDKFNILVDEFITQVLGC